MNEQFSPSTLSASTRNFIPLENIRVANPCHADWDKMEGDDRVRFCGSCEKSVYNLSSMSKADAERLIAQKAGKLCVQYYQRPDGTIITDNCPVGLKIARRPFKFLVAVFVALIAPCVAMAAKAASTPLLSGVSSKISGSVAKVNRSDARPIPAQVTRGRVRNVTRVAGKPTIARANNDSNNQAVQRLGDIACPAPTPTPKPAPKE